MSQFSALDVPSLKRFLKMTIEDRIEWMITYETSFRLARAAFWKLKAELQARKGDKTFPIEEVLRDTLFVLRSRADMRSWEPKKLHDDIIGIGREWDKMNAEQSDIVRDLELARGTKTEPEEMEESLLMRYLYWERAVKYKYNMPELETKEDLIQTYIKRRKERRGDSEAETSN